MSKIVSPQSILGQLGANLIEKIVLQMKYVWRQLLIFDVGIDGEIEICDPVTGKATNAIVKVQAKATSQLFQAETPDTFEYTCEQRDLNYWLRGNAPVVLIVCRPDSNEAYWISVKDYFKDLAVQKERRVHFDKHRDRFDSSCAVALKRLAIPKDSGLYFAPLLKTETLYTNLLKVVSFAPKLYLANTEYRRPREVWTEFKSRGVKAGIEWILTGKQIVSFHNLEEPPFNGICDEGSCESFDSTEWAFTDDEDRKREFVRLLNLSLRERTRLLGLRYDEKRDYYHFRARENLKIRKVDYQSIQLRISREVFKCYGKKSDPKIKAYCRHLAFKGNFLRLGNEWYLEITPTYHFTANGYDADKFRIEHLQGIQRLERNPAVIGQLLMWADFLSKPIRTLFSLEYTFLSFGELATTEINTSIPDDVWYQGEEDAEAQSLSDEENQPRLLGL